MRKVVSTLGVLAAGSLLSACATDGEPVVSREYLESRLAEESIPEPFRPCVVEQTLRIANDDRNMPTSIILDGRTVGEFTRILFAKPRAVRACLTDQAITFDHASALLETSLEDGLRCQLAAETYAEISPQRPPAEPYMDDEPWLAQQARFYRARIEGLREDGAVLPPEAAWLDGEAAAQTLIESAREDEATFLERHAICSNNHVQALGRYVAAGRAYLSASEQRQ